MIVAGVRVAACSPQRMASTTNGRKGGGAERRRAPGATILAELRVKGAPARVVVADGALVPFLHARPEHPHLPAHALRVLRRPRGCGRVSNSIRGGPPPGDVSTLHRGDGGALMRWRGRAAAADPQAGRIPSHSRAAAAADNFKANGKLRPRLRAATVHQPLFFWRNRKMGP